MGTDIDKLTYIFNSVFNLNCYADNIQSVKKKKKHCSLLLEDSLHFFIPPPDIFVDEFRPWH